MEFRNKLFSVQGNSSPSSAVCSLLEKGNVTMGHIACWKITLGKILSPSNLRFLYPYLKRYIWYVNSNSILLMSYEDLIYSMKLIVLLNMKLNDSRSTYTEIFPPFGMMEIMKSWVCVVMSLFNALRTVDMRVLQVVVCWYHLMDSACPNNFSLCMCTSSYVCALTGHIHTSNEIHLHKDRKSVV